jgi:hypothetical protein
MDVSSALGSVFAAFGLSGAAGLNAWLPLFVSALLARTGVVELGAPFDELQTNTGLAILGVATVADFVGDKIPAVDHVLHTIGTAVAPASGAVLFTGEVSTETDVSTVVSALSGAVVAEIVHLLRALIRPIATATTGGLANPVLSLFEDAGSAGMTAIAFILPLLAMLLLVGFVVVGVVLWRRRRSRRAAIGAAGG